MISKQELKNIPAQALTAVLLRENKEFNPTTWVRDIAEKTRRAYIREGQPTQFGAMDKAMKHGWIVGEFAVLLQRSFKPDDFYLNSPKKYYQQHMQFQKEYLLQRLTEIGSKLEQATKETKGVVQNMFTDYLQCVDYLKEIVQLIADQNCVYHWETCTVTDPTGAYILFPN